MKTIKFITVFVFITLLLSFVNAGAVSNLFLGQKTPFSYRVYPLEVSAEDAYMLSAESHIDIMITLPVLSKNDKTKNRYRNYITR